jgi:two-component system sensor histidine kinase KdpD
VATERPTPTREQLAVCAHDLRGSLTVIAGYVELLRRDDLTAEDRSAALAGIDGAIGRADALLADTLAGTVRTQPGVEPVHLAAVAEQAAADARAATGREVVLSASGDPVVMGDAVTVHRMLENLLANAAKYAPDGPIEIGVAEEGALAVIEVADRGPGIPADEREFVLRPFARLDRDLDTPGSGLGLTVVRSGAERMGGRIEVRGREGGGALFRIELPLARVAEGRARG